MRLSQYLILSIFAAARIVTSASLGKEIDPRRQSVNEAKLQEHKLFSRDLPPCTPCPKAQEEQMAMAGDLGDAFDASMFGDNLGDLGQDASLDSSLLDMSQSDARGKVYPANYIPPVCNRRGINCMYLAPGVKFIKGGLHKPIGHWILAPGGPATQIWAWRYWQSTLLFTGNGGSCTTYPAHCTVFTCCKGKMYAHLYDDNADVRGNGDGSNNAPNICNCFYHLDTDQYFGLMP